MLHLYDTAVAAAQMIRQRDARQPRIGLVLGSGLGPLADQVEEATHIEYHDIPGFVPTSVTSHAGRLVIGRLEGQTVAILQGRVHLYEGHTAGQVVLPLLVLWQLGITGVILTNAAGGINPDFREGALMIIRDHLNLTGQNPLMGPEDRRISQRFVDLTRVYDPAWRALARRMAVEIGRPPHEGVYLGLTGPTFETPAEIVMAARLGADAVGMSTVLEAIMAHAVGLRVLGLSCITNLAAGMGGTISHEEVFDVANRVAADFERLIRGVLRHLDDQ